VVTQASCPSSQKGAVNQHTAWVKCTPGYYKVNCPACCAVAGRKCRTARLETHETKVHFLRAQRFGDVLERQKKAASAAQVAQ
jgi:hypothetical protein